MKRISLFLIPLFSILFSFSVSAAPDHDVISTTVLKNTSLTTASSITRYINLDVYIDASSNLSFIRIPDTLDFESPSFHFASPTSTNYQSYYLSFTSSYSVLSFFSECYPRAAVEYSINGTRWESFSYVLSSVDITVCSGSTQTFKIYGGGTVQSTSSSLTEIPISGSSGYFYFTFHYSLYERPTPISISNTGSTFRGRTVFTRSSSTLYDLKVSVFGVPFNEYPLPSDTVIPDSSGLQDSIDSFDDAQASLVGDSKKHISAFNIDSVFDLGTPVISGVANVSQIMLLIIPSMHDFGIIFPLSIALAIFAFLAGLVGIRG